jgi:CHAT domain-containing protein/predicted negative regulator of RcsB-dependent stress response
VSSVATPPKKRRKQAPAPAVSVAAGEHLLSTISALAGDEARRKFFERERRLATAEFAMQLAEAVVAQGRIDTGKALSLADAALFLARHQGKQDVLAFTLRAKGNALNLAGRNQEAADVYEQALALFEKIKDEQQIARTLTVSVQALILLGEYDRAIAAADRARELFTKLGDTRRLARLANNVGNIYHRQDRFEEAIACYERAYEQLLAYGDSEELVIALSNMSMCLITLNDFQRALITYERAQLLCGEDRMPLLRAQADYNIAYLYYLRGQHSRAIEMLHAARHRCEANGDHYHFALCHLDLAEIYLELNLSHEAIHMAHEGQALFQKLGMGYEEAKCQAYEAMGFSQFGKAVRAIELFGAARAKFVREKNLVWPSLIDLYEALVLFNEGRLFESRRLCARAAEFFDSSYLPGKAVLCHLLFARLALRRGDAAAAEKECQRALERLAQLEAPVLSQQAHFLLGETQQASGKAAAAYESYQQARKHFESLRSSLRSEELKISFMKDRLEVYERLAEVCLADSTRPDAATECFRYVELAKSRSLAERMIREEREAPAEGAAGQSGLVRRIRDMREELNWYYRRIEQEQLRAEQPSPERIGKLQREALAHENELLRVLREVSAADSSGSAERIAQMNPAEDVRAALSPDAALIEFFAIRESLIAAVVTRDSLEMVPLTPLSRVANLTRMLDFQISKFRLAADYVRTFEKSLLAATQAHLLEIYTEIVAPLRSRLTAKHLVIVPHGILHYLPFHALFDGERYLADSFTISYAPSAGIFAMCQRKPSVATGAPLVIGVLDARAPFIQDEAESVSRALANSEFVLGAEAGEAALREKGADSRLIHIATHGQYRPDNPLFSGIRLGKSYLNLYDLYQFQLNADLVTLSGCATGMNVVGAGDELLGLVRGLLHAGARSLLLTLWDVQDRTTADFMTLFYRNLAASADIPVALRNSMSELRTAHPHPYYWAPFVLVGKTSLRVTD